MINKTHTTLQYNILFRNHNQTATKMT